jgi:D-amino-acid dehydrogenase
MTSQKNVVVIGAGIVGLSIAWRLMRAGCAVSVIDPEPPGMGASFGNAGAIASTGVVPLGLPGLAHSVPKMLMDRTSALHLPATYWIQALPWFLRFLSASRIDRVDAISKALYDLHWDAVELHQTTVNELGAPELIERRGHLYLYRNEEQLAKDSLSWELRRRRGGRFEKIEHADVRELEPAVDANYTLGIFLPELAHCINPHRYCQKLAEELSWGGGKIIRDKIVRLDTSDGKIVSARGTLSTYHGDEFCIAAGAWSAQLLRRVGLRLPLESQRGYHIMLPKPRISVNRCLVAADRKVLITPMEGGLRVGGTVEFGGTAKPPNAFRADLLKEDLRHVLPGASTEGVDGFWMGHRPCFPDSLPAIGRSRRFSNMSLAFGHGHLGLTGAARTARLIERVVAESASANADLAAYSPDRFGSH